MTEINDKIKEVIDSNTENTRKRKRGLYEKLNELYFKYITPGTDRIPKEKLIEIEYKAFKVDALKKIITKNNNIESGFFKVLGDNIKSLFDFKQKAAESIEKIKSYKDKVKSELQQISEISDASRIMNETKLLEYIEKYGKQENQ